MSFSTHPFKDFDIGFDQYGYYHWICDGCGKASRIFSGRTYITTIHLDYIRHIETSHKKTREDVKDWTSRVR